MFISGAGDIPVRNNPSGRVRVLHVYPSLLCGGVEKVIENIIRYSDSEKYSHDILTQTKGDNEEIFRSLGVTIHRVPVGNSKREYKKCLRSFFRSYNFEVVHCHSHREMSIVNKEASRAGIQVRIAHSHNAHQDITGIRRMLRVIRFWRHRIGATRLVGCSRDAIDWMFPYAGCRGIVIENAIDTSLYQFSEEWRRTMRKELGFADNEKLLINIGRASNQKNQKFLLEIARLAQKQSKGEAWKFLIVGDGPELPALRREIEESRLDNVELLGERRDVAKLLSASDIFIFPSIYEGVGLAALEAQASGLKVIASDNVPEEAELKKGMIVRLPTWSAQEWVDTISQNLESENTDDENDSKLLRKSSDSRESDYSLKRMIARLEELYAPDMAFWCRVYSGEAVTGGEVYDNEFAEVLAETASGRLRRLTVLEALDKQKSGHRKIMVPLKALLAGRKAYKSGLRNSAWFFNSSQSLYYIPLALYLKYFTKAKLIGITHHLLHLQMGGIKKVFYRTMEKFFLRLLDVSIVPSEFSRRCIEVENPSINPILIEIPFSHENSKEDIAKKEGNLLKIRKKTFNFENSIPSLLFVGTIERRKGLHYLLEAMALLKKRGISTTLRMVGKEMDSEYSKELREYEIRNNLEIKWEGYVDNSRKQKLMEESDVFVLPSLTEGYGMVLIESMMAFTPVVAFGNTGMIDVVGRESERGLLAKTGNAESLADCIEKLLTDSQLREKIIDAGYEYAQTRPTHEEFKQRVREICGNMLLSE